MNPSTAFFASATSEVSCVTRTSLFSVSIRIEKESKRKEKNKNREHVYLFVINQCTSDIGQTSAPLQHLVVLGC